MPVVAITHSETELPRFFADEDMARLRAAAEVRVLGGNVLAEIQPQLGDVEVLLGSWGMPVLDAALLTSAPGLRAVCYAAGSVKSFATPEAFARGLIITSAWQANAVPVAEVTVALITLANKRWFPILARMRSEGPAAWEAVRQQASTEWRHPANWQAVVGLIGLGAIGQRVAERLRTMDLRINAYDPHASEALFARLGAEREMDLIQLAARSDVVSLHAPDLPETAGLLAAPFFRAMKDGATFINTARGRLVAEADLIAELETGRISAHLDVTFPEPPTPESRLWRLPNCWLTPHVAGSTFGEIRRMGRWAIDDCLAILAGQPPRSAIHEAMLPTLA